MDDWISVRNILPRKCVDVLLHYTDGTIIIGCRFTEGFLYQELYGRVTHWMPLPKPPM